MSMYRGVVTNIDTAGLWVRIAEQGVVGPLPWTGQPPVVGGSVLVADAGQPGQPDLIVLGTVPGIAALTTTDHGVPRFDGTAGKIQTSALTISDTGVLGGLANGAAATDAVTKSQLDGKLTTPAAWTAYTPTVTGWTNTTPSGRWMQAGKLVVGRARVTVTGSTTVGATLGVTLPASRYASDVALADAIAYCGTNYYLVQARLGTGISVNAIGTAGVWADFTSSVPGTWATNDYVDITFAYEAA